MLCCVLLLSLCTEPSSLVLLEHLGQVHRCVFSQGVAVHVPLCVRERVHLCVCVCARVCGEAPGAGAGIALGHTRRSCWGSVPC